MVGAVRAPLLFYIILNMLSALDAVNFHTNTDRLSDCLVSASVRARVVYVSDSVYEFVQKERYNRACWG